MVFVTLLRLPAGVVKNCVKRSSFHLNFIYNSESTMPSENAKKAIVLLAKGAEEMELVIAVDVLRRAGIAVTVAGLNGTDPVKCSREVVVVPDQSLSDAVKNGPYDVVVLPGGLEGAKNLASSSAVGDLLNEQEKENRLIAAICAAPIALKAHNIGLGKDITSYPSFDKELSSDYKYKQDTFVTSGNIITSRGPGTAFDFALFVAETLTDKETAGKVAKGMLLDTDYAKQLQ